MFHYFVGKIRHLGGETLLNNDMLGIQVHYLGKRDQGEFFLYPYIDDNKKTIFYYCFDTIDQKAMFENLLKINGVWPKTAFQISQLPKENLQQALKNVDVKFFQAIPWIWPKSAKKDCSSTQMNIWRRRSSEDGYRSKIIQKHSFFTQRIWL